MKKLTFRITARDAKGFTLIEILMAVMLIAILATIAVSQFADFSAETKNGSVRESLSILREAIGRQYGQMRLRCGVTDSRWPSITAFQSNDITSDSTNTGCDTNSVVNTQDRFFVASGIPANPWSPPLCVGTNPWQTNSRNTVVAVGTVSPVGTNTVITGQGCGWQYDTVSGELRANTNNNTYGTGTNESSY